MKIVIGVLVAIIIGAGAFVVLKADMLGEWLFGETDASRHTYVGAYGEVPEELKRLSNSELVFAHNKSDDVMLTDQQVKDDVESVLALQRSVDVAGLQKVIDNPLTLTSSAGVSVVDTLAKRPFTNDLLEFMLRDVRALVAKEQVEVRFPQLKFIDPRIEEKVSVPFGLSYPSVNAAEWFLVKELLTRLVPQSEAGSVVPEIARELDQLRAGGAVLPLGIDRAEHIVMSYLDDVLSNNIRAADYLELVSEREWQPGGKLPVMPEAKYKLDYAVSNDASYDFDGKGILFTGSLENYRVPGKVHSPKLIIEIDKYADGGTNYLIETQIFENIPFVSHYEPYKVPGQHRFRIIALPATETKESNYLNNIGPWHELIIP